MAWACKGEPGPNNASWIRWKEALLPGVITSQVVFLLFFLMVAVARYPRLDFRSVQTLEEKGLDSTCLKKQRYLEHR